MLTTGSDAIAVVDEGQRVQAVVTANAVLAWVAAGAGNADQPITGLLRGVPPAIGSAASVVDGVLAMAEADADVLAVTVDGSPTGQLQTLVTPRDIARAFGDQPISILREIRLAANTQKLLELNHRARALVASVPHERGVARLGGAFRVPHRREHREAGHRPRG